MQSIKDIVPGYDIPKEEFVVFAQEQPQYNVLPAWRGDRTDGMVVTRWKLTWRERLCILIGGTIWLSVLTFNKPLQPVMMHTECPLTQEKGVDQ